MKNYNIKKILFRIIILLLFLPMLQAKFEFVTIAPLGGYDVKPEDVTISKDTWLAGSYQESKDWYLKSNFGFCNWAIRAEHQWAYNAYGMSRVGGLIIGKEEYLYEEAYINTRNGKDFLGEKRLAELAKKTRELQDTLRSLNKAFFFVMAPNKADYYPEFLPDKYAKPSGDIPTNYSVFSKELINNGVRYLDINAWFLSMKDTISMPLYSKVGIHYSTYGSVITGQRIIKEAEMQLNADLPELRWDELFWTDELQGTDNDLERALNLCFTIPSKPLAYPKTYIYSEHKHKARSIAIGDSYYWQLIHLGINDGVFRESLFWYYNREIYPGPKLFEDMNLELELNNSEVIFMIITPPNLEKYLGSFIETLHNFYFNRENTVVHYEEKIQEKMELIRNTPDWLEVVTKKAAEQNTPLDRMIYLDAKYVVDLDQK